MNKFTPIPVGITKEFFRVEDVAEMMRRSVEVGTIPGATLDKPITEGIKHDEGKPEYDRLAFDALGAFNDVHKFGDSKYARGNWKQGLHLSRLLNAAIRHISATLNGDLFDSESGKLHTAHAGVCLEMVTHFLLNHEKYKEFDDLDYTNHLTNGE